MLKCANVINRLPLLARCKAEAGLLLVGCMRTPTSLLTEAALEAALEALEVAFALEALKLLSKTTERSKIGVLFFGGDRFGGDRFGGDRFGGDRFLNLLPNSDNLLNMYILYAHFILKTSKKCGSESGHDRGFHHHVTRLSW